MKNGSYILVVAPKDYPGKLYRGKYCYEHHLVYWKYTGYVLLANDVIHHIDGNKTNNNFNNLKLLKKNKHDIFHNQNRKKCFVRLKCPGCNKIFIRAKNETHLVKKNYTVTCCSKKCVGKFTALKEDKKNIAIKENVIEEFLG